MVHRLPEPGRVPGWGGMAAHYDPPVRLLKLVSVDGIVEEKGEVGKQIEAIVDQIGIGLRETLLPLIGPLTVETVARGSATVGRIDGPKARKQTLVDGPFRDLIRRVPRVGVGRKPQCEGRGAALDRILEESIEFVDMLIMIPGAIVKLCLKGVEQMARAELRGLGHQDTIKIVLADADFGEALREG